MKQYNVVIIGAGAAGMMCAIEAGKRGRKVLVLDHAKSAGEKIRISGGGRCNFTNINTKFDRFLSQNPRFAISALKRYSQHDFIKLVESYKMAYHEKVLGQLFCDGSAKVIIDMLLTEMSEAGVELRLSTEVKSINKADTYSIQLEHDAVEAQSLVVACGGKSIPKMGATGFGYQIAEQFDLPVTETRPALVPLTFADELLGRIKPLSGVSTKSSVTCNKVSFDEALLFTHRGLSGPSILQISSYWREGEEIIVDLAQGINIAEQLKAMRQSSGKLSIGNALAKLITSKLAQMIVEHSGLTGNLADQNNAKLDQLGQSVNAWRIKPAGSEGYRTAEVTLGGVDTGALNAKTMEAKNTDGLYFIGEVVDMTGWLGGYNFQWAWSSGWVCGQAC
ncbi:NAD(P)/FAD-dependent oxidoreductase [Lentilitoribacter sp. Alg239-R112]|uniref:NAD(P)/FAD-dependent oxidoreductase n=1 Tax=Lentilitoribacter sp. Alg239-R112 TaxID=2305987 RepID=UPI0013A6FD45|nr:NAD(P)/FAD-dependent oxidoreductase [Lentilitoribacter sp. Alg239-R112]